MKLSLLPVALLLCSAPAFAESVSQYTSSLQEVSRTLDAESLALRGSGARPAPVSAAAIRAKLLPIKAVQGPSGRVFRVDAAALVAGVTRAEALKNRNDAADRLAAVSRRLSAEAALIEQGAADHRRNGRQVASAVLQRPEFQADPAPEPSVFQKWGDSISAWLKDHMPKPARNAGPNWSPNMSVIWTIVILLLVALFGLLVWVIVGAVGRRAVRARPLAQDDTEAALVEARDTVSILDLADEKARSGDHRSAFRLVYLATLVALDTGGILRFDRSKTNWEYLRALRSAGRGDIYDAMQPLTRDFDRLWYGFATALPDDYLRARRQFQELTGAHDEPVGAKR